MSSTRPHVIPPSDFERPRQGSTSSSQITNIRSPVSTIAVLPSSLPEFHKAYMKGHPKPPTDPQENTTPPHPLQTEEERAAQARRLRPNFRAVPDNNRPRPEPMTALPSKKSKPVKWQFGIRSRNQPAEAMLAIFKALKIMGADWEVPKIRRAGGSSQSRSRSGSRHSGSHSRQNSHSRSRGSSISSSSQDEYETSDREQDPDDSPGRRNLKVHNVEHSRGRQRKHHSAADDWGYDIPEDPWVINARFRKDGMYPPGVAHPSSTHSSRVDLQQDPAALRRRSSTNTSHSSLNHVDGITSLPLAERDASGSQAGDSVAGSTRHPGPDEAVFIYMSIQLYSIDRDFFVVDFKCAGYERLVSNLVHEIKATSSSLSISQLANNTAGHDDGWDDEKGVWRQLNDGALSEEVAREVREQGAMLRERVIEKGAGRKEGEKRCTSPFPFLDVASTLILQLSGE
jgi:carbon catabolite-derepressing protein kinase